ncbi:MAG: dihydrolipoyllysine-residue acetyltransferase [Pseudomonadota bacterium]|jgi:pyruvate dehydrogenase E2 component (dihydrolipoamide acetyltransferase)
MATIELKVPDIGDFAEVEVIELLVNPGDMVKVEQSLLTVESDKASMEIPSSAAGRIVELKVKLGDKVSEGSVIALIEAAQAGASAPAAAAPGPAVSAPPAAVAAAAPAVTSAAPAPAVTSAAAASSALSAPAAAPAADPVVVEVPDIGDFKEVEVIELLVRPGDTVKAEQSLITVESDKASMEIPSSGAGTVVELRVKIGDRVSKGSPVLVLRPAGAGAVPAASVPSPAPGAAESDAGEPRREAGPTIGQGGGGDPASAAPRTLPVPPVAADDGAHVVKPHATPSVRKYARELGVDLSRVRGSGPKQRILHEDVQGYVKAAVAQASAPAAVAAAAPAGDGGAGLGLLPWPKVDFAKFGPIETKPLPRIRRISAANLHRNWVMIPHVTNHEDADVTDLEAFRVQLNRENEKTGPKLTMLAFLIKACVHALKRFPEFNSSLEGDALVMKRYWHIGFAADTPNGLVVPVIRDADRKGVGEIATETGELAKKARDGKLSPAEMQGGTFSISSLGGIGGTGFTPIVNAPEVAILGVSRTATRPVWNGQAFVPRLILPLSLSYDHRVIDGAAAARFNAHLAQLLSDFRRVML